MDKDRRGVTLQEPARGRLERAAARQGVSAAQLAERLIVAGLDRLETDGDGDASAPFAALAREAAPEPPLRAAITAAYRTPEPECLPGLLALAEQPPAAMAEIGRRASILVDALRAKGTRGLVEPLLQEYSLSSQEGVALLCLAEALLRIPDTATRDALIRDKVGRGDWQTHLAGSHSLFVHAATWGLLVTGRLAATASQTGLSAALTKAIARGGEPVIRRGLYLAMRLLGEQFVVGQTIEEALANSRRPEGRGFRHSYDMLGEAALTAADAQAYEEQYTSAIHAIGAVGGGRGVYAGPGISVKLSALHPRYVRAQKPRVMAELAPRLAALTRLARRYDIGLNIDAEEADQLDISLDLLEGLCADPELAGWNGIGFVVQAYQKRAPYVIDYLIDLARRSGHRLMVRLVKGAYWDSEIKRAQADGLEGFPVFTRKVHTDVCYLACARKLLAAPDAVFPQFATHNAQTLSAVYTMAGPDFDEGRYEFQCLHGMGDTLYEEVVGPERLGRPCRIYAPVGTYETLLPYLVRRLLENGSDSSFVNRIANPRVPVDALVADPVAAARAVEPVGQPHPRIALPRDIFGAARANSAGFDLSSQARLGELAREAEATLRLEWRSGPIVAGRESGGPERDIRSPAAARDVVGTVVDSLPEHLDAALAAAQAAAPDWAATPPGARAAVLRRAADLLEARLPRLAALIVREAGRGFAAAIGEVREAVDFLRYDAAQIEQDWDNATHRPLGVAVTISPWNFPLSIFVGQIAASIAAGNAVLAKPAEETPLTAAAAVRLLHEAGIPRGVLQLLPGDGAVGAALVADARVGAVLFTGSTEVARAIQRSLAARTGTNGEPIPLVAETGGQNAMIVDSSALLEQVVADIIASAFDSAGQRCSALRILLVQEDIADRLLTMLKGAMQLLTVGGTDRLETDVGPVISAEARDTILRHIETMRGRGCKVFAPELPAGCAAGYFVAPTVIEVPSPAVLGREVFGPVVHVARYAGQNLEAAIDAVNALGYALTFGIHSRIDETIARATERIAAGNLYVNRTMIGAVVGAQPFGGHRLSGTGPKAGGPLYLCRLLARRPMAARLPHGTVPAAFKRFVAALPAGDAEEARAYLEALAADTPFGASFELPGTVGEQNTYRLLPRGTVLCVVATRAGALRQIGAALAAGNRALVLCDAAGDLLDRLEAALRPEVARAAADGPWPAEAALYEGDAEGLQWLATALAAQEGPVVPLFAAAGTNGVDGAYPVEYLLVEQAISVNTAAAGGNATLMTIG